MLYVMLRRDPVSLDEINVRPTSVCFTQRIQLLSSERERHFESVGGSQRHYKRRWIRRPFDPNHVSRIGDEFLPHYVFRVRGPS
jgi:hypothetical protein